MAVVGGRRTRFIRDSLEIEVTRILTALGWFDPARRITPIKIIPKPKKWDDPIEFNSITVSLAGLSDDEAEMGSNATDDNHVAYIDFYAERESIGEDVAGDLLDAFRGKMPSIDRGRKNLNVLNMADPARPVLFTVPIDRIIKDRAHEYPHPWQQFWFTIRFEILDEYYGDENQ